MKIKSFIFASIIYIAFIGGFAFFLDLGDYTLSIESFSLTLPIAIWFVAPLLIFFILALLHLSFYSLFNAFRFRHFFKDADKFEDFANDLLLEKKSKISFHTKEFKRVCEIAKSLKTQEKIPNLNQFNEILDTIKKIHDGEYVNLGKFKLENNNILSIQNEKNHLNKDISYAYNKIKNINHIKDELEQTAFELLLEKGTYEQIKNVKIPKNSQQVLNLIQRFKNKNLELSPVEFEVLLQNSNLDEKEYLKIAKMSVNLLNPDAILNIFLKIKNQKSEALRAYLYLLAEFSMFDELLEQIKNDDKKFADFKAVLALRDKNIKINLNQLIND